MPSSTEATTIVPATTKGDSVKTTVPLWLVRQMGLKAGDKLHWQLVPREGEFEIKVRAIKIEED